MAKPPPIETESTEDLVWLVETYFPSELRRTSHARSLARIRREMAECRAELKRRGVTD
jgi:hypothetical protein